MNTSAAHHVAAVPGGSIRPVDADDGVDLLVVMSSRNRGRFGQFVFSSEVLCERGIMSRNRSAGKSRHRRLRPEGCRGERIDR